MTDPTHLVLADGTVVELRHDHPYGWFARHEGTLVHVTAVRSSHSEENLLNSSTVTPAKWCRR